MTQWWCLISSLALVCLCVYCFGENYHKDFAYLWNQDGTFHLPKLRRLRMRRLHLFEDDIFPYLPYFKEQKKHVRRSEKDKVSSTSQNHLQTAVSNFYSKSPVPKGSGPGPSFAKEIGNVTVPLGREAKLECIVDRLDSFRVAWLRMETKTILTIHRHVISRNYRITLSHSDNRNWILHINNVQEADRGGYMCQVNTVPMLSQIGYLDVVVPPDIIDTESSSDVLAREGTDVSMICKAKGYPTPTLTWRREDHQPVAVGNWQANNMKVVTIPEEEKIPKNNTIHKGDTLIIRKVSRLHMGAYLCIASNGVPPSVSRRIMLQVNFPPMIWIPNQLVGAPVGDQVTIDCHTEAYPKSINYWTREEGEMIIQSNKYEVLQKVTTYKVHMVLTIKGLGHDDFGTYRCFARNSLGSTEGSIRLYEIHVPQQFKEPSTAKIQSLDGTSANGKYSYADGEAPKEKDTFSPSLNSSSEDYDKSSCTRCRLSLESNILSCILLLVSLINYWLLLPGS